MEKRPIKYDRVYYERQTNTNKGYIKWLLERAHKIETDPDKKTRIEDRNCRWCFYNSRIGGSAMTTTECGVCGDRIISGSTCIDVLCNQCSIDQRACKHCGGDINDKVKR